MNGPPAPAQWRAGSARVLARHRRLLAALLLAVAAGVAVDAASAEPRPGQHVVAAATDLAAGAVLGAGDVALVEAPAALVPVGAVDAAQLPGRRLAGPLRQGEVITDADLLGPGLLAGQPAGRVAVPVRPSEVPPQGLLRPGDRVQVLAGAVPAAVETFTAPGPAEVVVPSATVLAVPDHGAGGLLGEESSGPLLVAVTRTEAIALATAGDGRWLSVAVLP